jgi:hypothetical protein
MFCYWSYAIKLVGMMANLWNGLILPTYYLFFMKYYYLWIYLLMLFSESMILEKWFSSSASSFSSLFLSYSVWSIEVSSCISMITRNWSLLFIYLALYLRKIEISLSLEAVDFLLWSSIPRSASSYRSVEFEKELAFFLWPFCPLLLLWPLFKCFF